ncbi:beta-galactosidase [Gemmatimonadota bacterium]
MRRRKLNRRDFLLAVAGGGAAITLAAGGACRDKRFGNVALGTGGLLIDGKSVPLFGGGLDYWSYNPELWETLLDRLLRLGISTVSVSVPWSEHEVSAGSYDFGQIDPRRNVAGFIRLAGQRGFNVLLRPGVLHRLPGGCGVPERVLYDSQVAARTGGDTIVLRRTADGQYPAPSLFSRTLLREIGPWFDQLAFNLNPLRHVAGGPVVALMFESALSYLGALDRPYSQDYHPDALESYHRWLESRYQSVELLNRVYGTAYQEFEQVEPPREFLAERLDNLPAYLEWVEFRRWADNKALDGIVNMLAERGLKDLPVIRNAPLPDLEDFRQEPEGPGLIYDSASGMAAVSSTAYLLKNASRKAAGSGTYPFRASLGGGIAFPAFEGIGSAAEYEFVLMLSLMYGLKGWESAAMVEKNGWLAAPVRADGRVRGDYYNAYRRVCQLLRESHLDQYSRNVETVFLHSRSLDSLLSAATESTMDRDLLEQGAAYSRLVDLGLKTPVHACRTWAGQIESLLADVGFDWNYSNAGFSRRMLTDYKVAVLPASDFMFKAETLALDEYVRSGGTLVYGPGRPWLDESLRPDPATGRLFAEQGGPSEFESVEQEDSIPADEKLSTGRVIRLESPLGVGDLLKELEVSLPFTRTNTRIDLSLHKHSTGRMLLFAANSADRPLRTDIFFQGGYDFRDLLDPSTFRGEGKIRVEIPKRKVQVWEVSG